MFPRCRIADSNEKILRRRQISLCSLRMFSMSVDCNSLFSGGRKEADHLHGQLESLKVMLQVFSFHRETVLRERRQTSWTQQTHTNQKHCGMHVNASQILVHPAVLKLQKTRFPKSDTEFGRAVHRHRKSISRSSVTQLIKPQTDTCTDGCHWQSLQYYTNWPTKPKKSAATKQTKLQQERKEREEKHCDATHKHTLTWYWPAQCHSHFPNDVCGLAMLPGTQSEVLTATHTHTVITQRQHDCVCVCVLTDILSS